MNIISIALLIIAIAMFYDLVIKDFIIGSEEVESKIKKKYRIK